MDAVTEPHDQSGPAPRWARAFNALLVSHEDVGHRRIALLTLNEPDRRNAMSDDMTASWLEVAAELADDRDLAAVVVTGAGKAFCSGGDLSWLTTSEGVTVDELRLRMLRFYQSWLSIASLDVPSVAAINGAAVGAGFALALACDMRYIADDARVGVPFTRLGLHPGMGSTYTLPRIAGITVASDLLLTGRMLTGVEAVQLGLASACTSADDVVPMAIQAARLIAQAAPLATRSTRRALRRTFDSSMNQVLDDEALAQAVSLATKDAQEGLAAQREHRPPRFRGQ